MSTLQRRRIMMAQGVTYDGIPLTITNVSNNNAVIEIIRYGGLAPLLYYKKGNEKTYRRWKYDKITLLPQESMDIFGDNPEGFSKSQTEYINFRSSGGISVSGRVSSLSSTIRNYNYAYLFINANVVNISEDLFTEVNLTPYCFMYSFAYNKNLQEVPPNLLPFTTLSTYCYQSMFEQSGLKKVPTNFLPATNASNAYYNMFRASNVSDIEVGAVKATSASSLSGMFQSCHLENIKEGAFNRISSSGNGTFTRMFGSCNFYSAPTQLTLNGRNNYVYANLLENNKNLQYVGEEFFNNLSLPLNQDRLFAATFSNCTSLQSVSIPYGDNMVINRPSLFFSTFKGCTSLNRIEVKFTSWTYIDREGVEQQITPNWLTDVSPTGTFICPKELAEATDGYYDEEGNFIAGVGRGDSTVPEGWTIDFPIIDARGGDTNAMALMAVISQQTHADGTPWVKDSLVMMKSEAEKVEDIGTVFRGNGDIRDFTALQYFKLSEIKAHAFYSCYNLAKVILPNTITSLGDYCLSYTSIDSLIIPDSVVTIGEYVTNGTRTTKSVFIGKSVNSLDYRAIIDLDTCESIEVHPDNQNFDSRENCNAIIQTEGNQLLCGCASTIIPNTVTSIGSWAFQSNNAIAELTIPTSVVASYGNAFGETTNLKKIYYEGSFVDWFNISFNNSRYSNPLVEKKGISLIIDGENVISETMIIPEGVTSVRAYVFPAIPDIKHIVVPSSVDSWSTESFYNNSLESIVVNSTNTKYDSREGCNAIVETASNKLVYACKNTIIPNSVTEIGHSAFRYTSVSSTIEIPESVNTIANWSFNNSNIKAIKINVETPPKLGGTSVFVTSTIIYVPDDSVEIYKAANLWSALASRIKPISELP